MALLLPDEAHVKIDLGPDGRILGTKKVSPNGQVSGFTEYAGLDVLVILPGGRTPVVRRDAADLLAEAEALVRERMELAFQQYRHMRERYPTPEAAARAFLNRAKTPKFRGIVSRADAWIREQLGAELAARSRTKDERKPPKGRS